MISVDGLTVEFGGSALFSDVSFVINEKDRIALMGKNGAGKSTLLKILAGVREPSRGKVSAPKDTVIAYLPQHLMTEDGRTVFEETAQAFAHLHEMEAEIADMDSEEKALFLSELGLENSGLDRLIQASYRLLGLISYLTAGAPEERAWTITKGTKAPQAAGKIHSDFERGFIRAEVVSFEDLKANGSMNAAKEKGLVRSEGKEYVVQDGDIILFRFNV